ncbi:MAG: F420-dependent methylenetetrahydromethanopterin dehydrogenase [Candidatus Thorarchaeota archaeon]|nr:F420-dependent methylenetetrahydromethanopterin dehydrogenase [Candidatus Thorarchaeota archaeon]
MDERKVKVAVLKMGCIGAAPLLEYLLDERAQRKDIEVRAFSSGSKLLPEFCRESIDDALRWSPDLAVLVSPNAALPGPTLARDRFHEANIAALTVGDGPSLKAFQKKDADGEKKTTAHPRQGFVILPMDPMIGARKETLDATEMVLFNSDLLRVLSVTGVVRLLRRTIDGIVQSLAQGKEPEMPKLHTTKEDCIKNAGFHNPYARAKAYAALQMTESVATLTTEACFREKEKERCTLLATAAHELLRAAARLADEAREVEKTNDALLKTSES